MALAPAITDLEQLKDHPAVARLLAWHAAAIESVKYDREELTIVLPGSLFARSLCLAAR